MGRSMAALFHRWSINCPNMGRWRNDASHEFLIRVPILGLPPPVETPPLPYKPWQLIKMLWSLAVVNVIEEMSYERQLWIPTSSAGTLIRKRQSPGKGGERVIVKIVKSHHASTERKEVGLNFRQTIGKCTGHVAGTRQALQISPRQKMRAEILVLH